MTVTKSNGINTIFYQFYRFIFKTVIYTSIFMMMELGGRFIKNEGYLNGFVNVPMWMILVYMNIAWLDDIMIPWFNKKNLPKWLQAFFIMIIIYAFEFSFGMFFKYMLGITVWDYSNANFMGYKVNLFGVISLWGLLPWYGISWFLLWLYPRVKLMVDGIYASKEQS